MDKAPKQESPEVINDRLSKLHVRADELRKLIEESKENIDVELGSDEYIDHGYTAELHDEVLPEIERLETLLREMDDKEASQRKLI